MKCLIKIDRAFSISQQVWNDLCLKDKESTIYQSYQWNKHFYLKLSSKFEEPTEDENPIIYTNEVDFSFLDK